MSQKFKNKKIDDYVNFKNLVNGNLFEIIKPAIKQKANENVMKMMDLIKEKPDSWFELIGIAIFHQNYQIMKYMIETFGITSQQIPLFNALSLASDISADSSKQKSTENKDSYLEVECPLIIQAAIGGDIDIFKYLIDNGFGDNFNTSGHIALSKKYKNSVVTNCIGACAYYGRHKLLQYILENYQRKVDINYRAIEKKCKAKHSTLTKEYSEATPLHLVIESDHISNESLINCIKVLDEYKASLIEYDARGNSILHVAAKNNKLNIVKYIIEELHMENLAKETNKEGQTPMSIAQYNQSDDICDYLRNNTEQPDEKIEEDLMELMKDQPKKKTKGKGKKKKNKKGGNDNEFGLLNMTEYQETLKIEKPKEKEKEKPVEKEEKQVVPMTTKEEEAEYEELEKEEIQREDYIEIEDKPKQKQRNQQSGKYNQNQKQQQYQSGNSYYNNKQQNNYNNKKNYQQRGYNNSNNTYNKDYQNDYDYDYYSKGNRNYYDNYNKGYYNYNNNNNSNTNSNQDYQQKDRPNKKNYYLQEVTSTSTPIEKTLEPKITEQIELKDPSLQTSEPYIISKDENNSQPLLQKEQFEEEMEENDEEEDFLEEEPKATVNNEDQHQAHLQHQQLQQQKEQVYEKPNLENKIDYTELSDKYHQLEMKYDTVQKEKRELESFIQSNYSSNRKKTSQISSTEENINDLLELANEELEQKSKEISQLQKKAEMINLANIKNYNLSQLNQMKELFTANLALVEDAILSLHK